MQAIAQAMMNHYRERLLALGVYGSLARQEDGPFSDIEMHCIIQGKEIERTFEWSTGPWKAEVDVYSPEVILARAAEVDGDWSFTHGAFVRVLPLFDPQDFFTHLRETVLSQPEEVFCYRIKEVIVGDLYELVGKVRNAWEAKSLSSLPTYTLYLTRGTAGLIGLAHRILYHSFATLYEEALALPDAPQGFAELCCRVMSGQLSSSRAILREVNKLWMGIEQWAEDHHIELTDQLETLLKDDK